MCDQAVIVPRFTPSWQWMHTYTHRGRRWGVCFLVFGSSEKRGPFTVSELKPSVGQSRTFLFSQSGRASRPLHSIKVRKKWIYSDGLAKDSINWNTNKIQLLYDSSGFSMYATVHQCLYLFDMVPLTESGIFSDLLMWF